MITKRDIKKIKKEWPDLTVRGIRWYNKMSKQSPEDFLSKESISNIKHAAYFLKLYQSERENNCELWSNSLKVKQHMERVTDCLVTSGEFIVALIFMDYEFIRQEKSAQVICDFPSKYFNR